MAGLKPPKPRFLAGEFVTYRCAEDAVVDNILDSGLGFNIYAITMLKDGTTRRVAAQTLSTSHLQAEFMDDSEDSIIYENVSRSINLKFSSATALKSHKHTELFIVTQVATAIHVNEVEDETREAAKVPKPCKPRFPTLTRNEKDTLAANRLAAKTLSTTKFCVKVFQGDLNYIPLSKKCL